MFEETLIEVTQEDISKGQKCSASNCPITLAAERKLGLNVATGSDHIDVYSSPSAWYKSYRSFKLPEKATDWIAKFDSMALGVKVEPFSFYLGEEILDEFE